MRQIAEIQLPKKKHEQIFKWSVFLLGILFFLNCFTPLRLHYDMLRYFAIKDCIESQCPPGADPTDYLPYGYTALLLILSKLGILRSFPIVFVNCLYLFGGITFVRKLFSYIKSPYLLFFLVLMNWTIIKFVTHPLSEMQYLFFSMSSLYAFYLFIRDKMILHLIIAFLLAAMAFLTRTVGIALIAALFVSLVWEYRNELIALMRKNKILVIVLAFCVALLMIFSRQLGLNHYTGVMNKQFGEGLKLSEVIGWHFSEWGEILLNTSKLKIMSMLPGKAGIFLFLFAGILGIAGFVYLCFIKKNKIPFVVKSYLLFYILLMFNWPFPDPRFWVPIIPLLAAVISQIDFNQNSFAKGMSVAYLVFYSILGISSMAFITYTSFNKREFAKSQAKGVYRNEYEIHFFGRTLSDTATQVDSNLVQFLHKYDK